MKATTTLFLVALALVACRDGGGGSGHASGDYDCDDIEDCYRGEVCAAGECYDMDCDRGTDVCCRAGVDGAICRLQSWSDSDTGGGFHPLVERSHPGMSVDEAYLAETAHDECRFARCDETWER